eukprot:739292-Prorocentrum_minimum.AAC.1
MSFSSADPCCGCPACCAGWWPLEPMIAGSSVEGCGCRCGAAAGGAAGGSYTCRPLLPLAQKGSSCLSGTKAQLEGSAACRMGRFTGK